MLLHALILFLHFTLIFLTAESNLRYQFKLPLTFSSIFQSVNPRPPEINKVCLKIRNLNSNITTIPGTPKLAE